LLYTKERMKSLSDKRSMVGVDEVGRGPAAGPVTVAAVILPEGLAIEGLTDSKLMSEPDRIIAARRIKRQALAVGIGWVTASYIDEFGLTKALHLAGSKALQQIAIPFDHIILDGIHNYLMSEVYTECIPKAELKVQSVAAASVVAKVARDDYMHLMHKRYPQYGLDRHKGYLSAAHMTAIQQHGLSPIHRVSWGSLHQYAYNNGGREDS
jgi:ribonuclease HII